MKKKKLSKRMREQQELEWKKKLQTLLAISQKQLDEQIKRVMGAYHKNFPGLLKYHTIKTKV